MNKKILLSTLFAFLLLLSTVPVAFAVPDNGTDETTLIIDTIGEPETVDPAWGYDTGSSEVIQNVYEPLTGYRLDRRDGPYAGAKTDTFVPRIAVDWEYDPVGFTPYTDPDTGIEIRHRFVFEIRTGVLFHPGGDGTDWGTLTPEDVEYSYEREMVQDRDGGPQWMIYEYLLNTYYAEDPVSDPDFGTKIDHAVESDDTYVWFNIASDFPEVTIQQINNYCGGIVCKDWAVSLGDFDGDWGHTWEYIWDEWHNPPTSIIEYVEGDDATKCVGTGPYRFEYWSHGSSWSVEAFPDYWGGWPSLVEEDPGAGDNRLAGSLDTIIWYLREMWTTRRPRILAGDSDFTDVDRLYRDQVLGYKDPITKFGVRCHYPISVLSVTGYFFTFDLTTTSPYTPQFYAPGTFGTNGIPPDIFNDVNVRMGFAYAFDYNSWLTNVFLGEGWQPPEAIIRGLAYNRRPSENIYAPYDEETILPAGPPYRYYYDMAKAAYYLKLAFGGVDANSNGVIDPINEPGDVEGALWTGGMKMTVCYNSGNVARQLAAEMVTSKVNSLNPGVFVLDPPFAVPWGSTYLPQMVNGELPLFMIGWAADYPDPHNFAHPFYHTYGTFSHWQKYSNPTMDNLIETGIQTPDGPERSEIYLDLQELAVTDVPSVTLVQALGRHYERDWVRGYYYHPLNQDYFYHFYKAPSQMGDANNDGAEDIADKGYIAAHWTGEPGTTYNPSADVSGGIGGTTGSDYGLVIGIMDGVVDIVDSAVLNANWD